MVDNKEKLKKLVTGDLYELLYRANKLREEHFGKEIKFCSVINAKSGKCSEDCCFCSQSTHYNADVVEYKLKKSTEILIVARDAEKSGAKRFGIVTSGKGVIAEEEWEEIYRSIELLNRETKLLIDASLGCIDLEHAKKLKQSGLNRYHHNLETSEKYFTNVCTTHSYRDRLNTLEVIKGSELELCSGGLFGLGETWNDRIELALTLKEINPNAVPINFLNPIAGTPLANKKILTSSECLRIIALYRLILPDKDICVCGGREKNLDSMQNWMYFAGANGSMLGNYLTTAGRDPKEDLKMIKDLGLILADSCE